MTCVSEYKKQFPNTTRTDVALKQKFNWLRDDIRARMNGLQLEKTEEDIATDFLYPAFVENDGEYFYLHKKSRWSSIRVGISADGRRAR